MTRERASSSGLERLVRDASHGPVTFVLGAGVSAARGVPCWFDLAADMYFGVTGERPAWLTRGHDDTSNLQRARELLRGKLDDAFIARLHACPPEPHPLALPIVFERIETALAEQRSRPRAHKNIDGADDDGLEEVDETFASLLRDAMYRRVRRPRSRSPDTLAALARVLRDQQRYPWGRIKRVITFNADDLLEREVHAGMNPEEQAPIVWPIARASHNAPDRPAANGLPSVPIYHIHGFLPRDPEERWWADAPDTLVFTESQYWLSLATPLSFANRVMINALHDSHCVFIGLSMTDINIMRWLGIRYIEIQTDRLTQKRITGHNARLGVEALTRRSLMRHYWVRTQGADPTGLVSSHLFRRGVTSVVLEAWGPLFAKLMKACFPEESAERETGKASVKPGVPAFSRSG